MQQDMCIFATGHTQKCNYHGYTKLKTGHTLGCNRTCAKICKILIWQKSGSNPLFVDRTCALLQQDMWSTDVKICTCTVAKMHMSCCNYQAHPLLQLSCCKYAYGQNHLCNYQGRDYQRHSPLWWWSKCWHPPPMSHPCHRRYVDRRKMWGAEANSVMTRREKDFRFFSMFLILILVIFY